MGFSSMNSAPSWSIDPQLGAGGGIPTPRKLSAASVRMAKLTAIHIETMIHGAGGTLSVKAHRRLHPINRAPLVPTCAQTAATYTPEIRITFG